jgi:tetratricopeptide (TPR) repeat protein
VAAARQAADLPSVSIAQVAWQLSEALRHFFELRSHRADWQVVSSSAIRAAEHAGNRAEVARALVHLGVVYGQQRRYQDATDCFEWSLAIWRTVGDPHGQGIVLNNLGNVHLAQGRYPAALGYYEQTALMQVRSCCRRWATPT